MNSICICQKPFAFLAIFSAFLWLYTAISLIAQEPYLQEHDTKVAELYAAAQSLFEQQKYKEAISIYQRTIVEHHQKSAKAYLMVGRCYFEQKAYSLAAQWFEELVLTFPGELESMQMELKKYWGASLFYQQRYEEALKAFDLYPRESEREIRVGYLYRLADTFYALKRYEEALKMYEKILREYPPSSRKVQAQYRKEKCETVLSTSENGLEGEQH